MAELAHRLGLAKGTLYLYFETKEELFAILLEGQVSQWLGELLSAFREMQRPSDPAKIAEVLLTHSTARQPFLRLLPMSNQLLKGAYNDEQYDAFGRRMLTFLLPIAAELERLLPDLTPGYGLRLLLNFHGLLMGTFIRLDRPGPVHSVLLEDPDLIETKPTLESEFRFAAEAIMRGVLEICAEQGTA